jgi:hypothetical protein
MCPQTQMMMDLKVTILTIIYPPKLHVKSREISIGSSFVVVAYAG